MTSQCWCILMCVIFHFQGLIFRLNLLTELYVWTRHGKVSRSGKLNETKIFFFFRLNKKYWPKKDQNLTERPFCISTKRIPDAIVLEESRRSSVEKARLSRTEVLRGKCIRVDSHMWVLFVETRQGHAQHYYRMITYLWNRWRATIIIIIVLSLGPSIRRWKPVRRNELCSPLSCLSSYV